LYKKYITKPLQISLPLREEYPEGIKGEDGIARANILSF